MIRYSLSETLFVFDLDGTVTEQEILPVIGAVAGLEQELAWLTARTLTGEIDFVQSFRQRFQMLRHVPLERVAAAISAIPLNPHIEAFILSHQEQCVLVTGNLDRWIHPLAQRLGCACYCSTSRLEPGGGLELVSVLDKGAAVLELLASRTNIKRIIAVGESVNDLSMFQHSDIGIAFGGVHTPVPEIMRIADYVVYDGQELCRLLKTFIHPNIHPD